MTDLRPLLYSELEPLCPRQPNTADICCGTSIYSVIMGWYRTSPSWPYGIPVVFDCRRHGKACPRFNGCCIVHDLFLEDDELRIVQIADKKVLHTLHYAS